LKPVSEVDETASDPVQRKNWISSDLPRSVDQRSTAAVHSANFHHARREVSRIQRQVGDSAFTTDGHNWRVLADDQRSQPIGTFSNLVDESFLKSHRSVKIHHSQQVDIQRDRRSALRSPD
jgi:hypothetical protein